MQMRHVLYVEDNPMDATLVRQAVAEAAVPATVHVVPNAVQAFSFLARQAPFAEAPSIDLVLLDLNLPIIDGVRALSLIKTSPDLKSKPVAVFTSSERAEELSRCIRLGVIACEKKPQTYEGYLALARKLGKVIDEGCLNTTISNRKESTAH
jgi:CheY-like chemotaxis protein